MSVWESIFFESSSVSLKNNPSISWISHTNLVPVVRSHSIFGDEVRGCRSTVRYTASPHFPSHVSLQPEISPIQRPPPLVTFDFWILEGWRAGSCLAAQYKAAALEIQHFSQETLNQCPIFSSMSHSHLWSTWCHLRNLWRELVCFLRAPHLQVLKILPKG